VLLRSYCVIKSTRRAARTLCEELTEDVTLVENLQTCTGTF